jgi:hypothetical protein
MSTSARPAGRTEAERSRDQAQVFQTDAQLLRDAGDHRAAYVVLENAIKRYPDNPDLLYDYALVAKSSAMWN